MVALKRTGRRVASRIPVAWMITFESIIGKASNEPLLQVRFGATDHLVSLVKPPLEAMLGKRTALDSLC